MKRRKQLTIIIIGIVFLCFFSGCASSYKLTVDALSNPEFSGTGESYAIVTRDSAFDKTDETYQKVESCVKTALSGRGMYEAASVEKADVILDISYGVSVPRVEYKTYSEVVQTQPDRVVESVVYVTIVDPNTGKIRVVPQIRRQVVRGAYGTVERIVPVTTYQKFLRITAHDNLNSEENERLVQAWSVYVKSEDESEELDKYIPLLAAASLDYVGENTQEAEQIVVSDNDDDVIFVKNGL